MKGTIPVQYIVCFYLLSSFYLVFFFSSFIYSMAEGKRFAGSSLKEEGGAVGVRLNG
jgi:hypothetical protein